MELPIRPNGLELSGQGYDHYYQFAAPPWSAAASGYGE